VSIQGINPPLEFTLRDEANAICAYAFRNGFLEDLHAGKPSPLLTDPGYSRVTDDVSKANELLKRIDDLNGDISRARSASHFPRA